MPAARKMGEREFTELKAAPLERADLTVFLGIFAGGSRYFYPFSLRRAGFTIKR
jgi:hypothetical protein